MIALVTDSNSQIPSALVERYGITVVPLTVTVDGVDHLEGVDLDADAFYARFRDGAVPTVRTAQPSPGRLLAVYERLAGAGAEQILSVHIGSSISGTVNSARVASASAPLPVRIVDTGQASFGITLCLWAGADALGRGGSVEEAASAAEQVALTVGNVFAVQTLDLARAGGRLATGAGEVREIPVMTMTGGVMHVVGQAADLDEVADHIAAAVRRGGENLRVGVGVADRSVLHLWEAMEERLAGAPEVTETVRYRVGPSVGAHTGPGTVGAMFAPAPSPGPAVV
jgi:DegV family protein with EDD domain